MNTSIKNISNIVCNSFTTDSKWNDTVVFDSKNNQQLKECVI